MDEGVETLSRYYYHHCFTDKKIKITQPITEKAEIMTQ